MPTARIPMQERVRLGFRVFFNLTGQWLLPQLTMFMCSESHLVRGAAAAVVLLAADPAKDSTALVPFALLGSVHAINSETCSYLKTILTDAQSAISVAAGHFTKFMRPLQAAALSHACRRRACG